MSFRTHNAKDSTWNQHNGVGVTLMDNWVEERAVGAERVVKERNVRYISERGHLDILVQDQKEDAGNKYNTISRISYLPSPTSALRRSADSAGRFKSLKEKKWILEAVTSLQPKAEPQPGIYESTTAASYFHKEFEPALSAYKLPPSARHPATGAQVLVDTVPVPVTFWSHQMARGAHTVYSSTPHGVHPHANVRATVIGHTAVDAGALDPLQSPLLGKVDHTAAFGRHVAFSTPIAENLKGAHKE